MNSKVIFVFLDGVGMGEANENNPFCSAYMPFLNDLFGGPLTNRSTVLDMGILVKGIDACLDVAGIPQSATGQTALFTGVNAARELGYHLPAYPDKKLTEIIYRHSLFKKAREAGLNPLFGNAYDIDRYRENIRSGKLSHSVTTLSVMGADLPFCTMDDLRAGTAVYWDIVNHFLLEYQPDIEIITGATAGKRIASRTEFHDLVAFECFLPDLIGHRRDMGKASFFLSLLDEFLKGIIQNMDQETTLVVTSDHGNMEDLSTGMHTRNPVPLLAVGNEVLAFAAAESIVDIPTLIMDVLGTRTAVLPQPYTVQPEFADM